MTCHIFFEDEIIMLKGFVADASGKNECDGG